MVIDLVSVSTLMAIEEAIERLSPVERVELHSLVWPEETEVPDTPPGVREKLAEAAQGHFSEGTRANLEKIYDYLQ